MKKWAQTIYPRIKERISWGKKCPRKRRSVFLITYQTGFSLVELLISFSIVSFLILGILQLTLYSLSLKRRSEDGTKSAELAASKLEFFKSFPYESADLSSGPYTDSLECSVPRRTFHREWSIKETSPNMKKIEINCYSESSPEKKTQLVLFFSRELGF